MSKIYISKLDAALGQLTTAIDLFLHYGDPVSIHTLSSAAQEILESIGKSQNIKTLNLTMADMVRPRTKKRFSKITK